MVTSTSVDVRPACESLASAFGEQSYAPRMPGLNLASALIFDLSSHGWRALVLVENDSRMQIHSANVR